MTSRIFDRTRLWRLSDQALAAVVALLAESATRQFGPFDQIVGVAEGGRIPALRIGAFLHVPVHTIQARHNPTDALYTPASGQVWCDTGPLIPTGQVLIVDDICGSGATLQTVQAALSAKAAPGTRFVTATLCRNAGATIPPNLWVWDDLRDWIVFPWEPPPETDLVSTDLPIPTRVYRG